MTELSPEQAQNFRAQQDYWHDREIAYDRTLDAVAGQLRGVIESIDEMDFGHAKRTLSALLDELPHGDVMTISPLFEEFLAATRERREASERARSAR